ncbi:MAG: hypothetical protein B6U97_01585 [Candidatus Altiarchaeales archaeon ex4484_96]|nr:MAG: hypothetical protein B6U97_01585 [Candidatus Altiarchaeales archaeon ex4484_96]
MKPKILIADKIHDKAIEEAKSFADVELDFNLSPKELIEGINKYDALIVRSGTKVTRDVIWGADKLRIIGRAGVGLDNIDLEAAREKNIEVVNSPEASTISVAELTLGAIIALMRNIHHGHSTLKQGRWDRSRLAGNELYGKKLGIIGFGRIGREVADRARAFGMDVLAFDPSITGEDARENNCEYRGINDLIREADVLSLHVPLNEQTRNLIDAKKIAQMKKNAVIINVARGGVVNEKDLYEALKKQTIRGAALDVFETEPPEGNPLLTLDNIILTPHLGASTEEAQINAGTVVVEKIRNHFRTA